MNANQQVKFLLCVFFFVSSSEERKKGREIDARKKMV